MHCLILSLRHFSAKQQPAFGTCYFSPFFIHGIIFLYDAELRFSMARFLSTLKELSPEQQANLPKVVCAINALGPKSKIKPKRAKNFVRKYREKFYPLEHYMEANNNFERPLLYLLRKLTGHADLTFEESHLIRGGNVVYLRA